jgi:hypothetical protein
MVNNTNKKDGNNLLNKLKKNHSSPSHMLYMFILGSVITLSLYIENDGMIASLCFFIVTLLYGVRFFYLIKLKKTNARSRLLLIALLSILAASTIFYMHETYFFNPVTFKKSAFLYETWNYYKKPISMEISGGSSQVKKVTDPFQIRLVINDIEKTSNIKVSVPKNLGPTYEIFFHTGNTLFQQVFIYPNYNIVQFVSQSKNNMGLAQKPKYVYLSPELLGYVKNQLE